VVIGVEAAGCVVALWSVVLVEVGLEVGLGLEIGAKAEVEMFVEFEATRGAVALI
jgi:hypothetical protein